MNQSCLFSSFPVFSLASPSNNSGKTTLATKLLEVLDFPAAVKFTTVRQSGFRCPRTQQACSCENLEGNFKILDDPTLLGQQDTDTGDLIQAGAHPVFWCLCRPPFYSTMLQELEQRLQGKALLTEGNSVLQHLPQARIAFVLRPDTWPHRFKDDTLPLLRRSRLIWLNSNPAEPRVFPWKDRFPEAARELEHCLSSIPVLQWNLRFPPPTSLLLEAASILKSQPAQKA